MVVCVVLLNLIIVNIHSLLVLLPSQVIAIIGDEKKEIALGVIGAFSALSTSMYYCCCLLFVNSHCIFFSVFIGPAAGFLSDHLVTRLGKRMPLILLGSILYSIATILRIFIVTPGVQTLVVNATLLILGDMVCLSIVPF
jgi:MFS family permease